MRFVRNQTLKDHLNAHFELNNIVKRSRATGGDNRIVQSQNVQRDRYQTFDAFIAPLKHKSKVEGKLYHSPLTR
jgi:hypothetical protein